MTRPTLEEARDYQRRYREEVRLGLRVRRTMEEVKGPPLSCDRCGKKFHRSPANRLRQGSGQYCSRSCMAAAYTGRPSPKRGPTIEKPCDNCGTIVSRPRWWAKQNRHLWFCDRACFGEWKSKNWTANANPSWKGGHPPYYGANWKRQSREARRRDKYQCRLCGLEESQARRALDVHHIVPFRLFGVDRSREANRLANLLTLCDRCHTRVEKFSDGSIVDVATLLQAVQPLPLHRP